MAHQVRQNFGTPGPDVRRASVLALLYPVNGALQLLFIQRTSPPGDHHAGQIGFPGGSAEAGDASPLATALREAQEEVGIDPEAVEVLGALTPLFIPISNFLVDPFAGYLPARPAFMLQASEIERTLELPLLELLDANNRQLIDRELTNGLLLKKVPHYVVGDERVWGATAMMTAELLALLDD